MNHILASRHHSRSQAQSRATENDELFFAFQGMATGITRPYGARRPLDDANEGKKVRPLGVYTKVSEAVARAGGSWYFLTRPLYVQLARLRAICNPKVCLDMKDAIRKAAQEGSEAEVSVLSLALSANCPDTSSLASADKELREAIQAEEVLAECIESKLYAEKSK